MNKHIKSFILTLIVGLFLLAGIPTTNIHTVSAANPTDEILNFDITVTVNDDASLNMLYRIEWKVLDSDSLGPLEWVNIGVPNAHIAFVTKESDNISKIDQSGNSLTIYFNKSYYKNEIADFSFSFRQNNMYQIDKYEEGQTVYTFTPAWFDDFSVDHLTIKWAADKADSWQPDCSIEGDWLVFERSNLAPRERYTMSVTYPNDAFGFSSDGASSDDDFFEDDFFDTAFTAVSMIGILIVTLSPIFAVVGLCAFILKAGGGFGRKTKKVITRTKITYYDSCPGCGAARIEGNDTCAYCGHDMIKSKEIVTEKDIDEPEKYTSQGTYHYGSSGNTYIHVAVTNVPVARPPRSHSSSGSSYHSGRGGGGGGCACACASHCACACACASSGRAGCSVKNFFDPKMHQNKIKVDSK